MLCYKVVSIAHEMKKNIIEKKSSEECECVQERFHTQIFPPALPPRCLITFIKFKALKMVVQGDFLTGTPLKVFFGK